MNYEQDTSGICAKGCGFFGSSATRNLCSKCYEDYLKQVITKLSMVTLVSESCSTTITAATSNNNDTSNNSSVVKNRCDLCKKRVGLTGFGCRCGGIFCGTHRFPEEHSCTFDFKTSGRVALAKDNLVCKTDKLYERF